MSTLPTLTHSGEVSAFIDRFLSFQDVRQSTKDTYSRALKQFFVWIHESGRSLQTLEMLDLLRWKNELMDAGTSNNTVNLYLTCLLRNIISP